MKRAVLVGVSAVALVAGPLSVVSVTAAAPAYACPWGTVPSHFEGVCVKGTANGSGPQAVPPQTRMRMVDRGPAEWKSRRLSPTVAALCRWPAPARFRVLH